MKKRIVILLMLALVLSMTACGTKEPSRYTDTEPNSVTAPKVETDNHHTETSPAVGFEGSDDLETQIENEIESELEKLTSELDTLAEEIDDYHAYMERAGEVTAFYNKISATSINLCARVCNYAVTCAEGILESGKSTDEMYDNIEIIYDLIYEDIGDEIYDAIYDGILDDMYDAFYDGALDDLPDDVAYADWSDARSEAYEQWADARSDAYEQWADFRSNVYGFWADLRSDLWGDDLEDAQDELDDFREDVAKIANNAAPHEEPHNEEAPTEATAEAAPADGIRPEFKEAMDSYEAFFDEYVVFMKAYINSDDPFSLMSEYSVMMQQYVETMSALESVDEDELSDEEVLYYTEVILRINQKLLEVT